MADVKISGLPAATTPVAGTEVLPIVQSSATKKVSIADLTTGRTMSSIGYQLGSGGIITEAGATRTLAAGDNGKIIYCTSGSAVTINCDAGLGAGFSCTIIQAGAGKVTVDANGQTLVSYSNLLSTIGQYAVISVVCPVANTFLLAGNLGV
jgi:hypothetical protein